jgi:diguanylate cyclase (GGDEF)-like protein/PAS domain S-box-containing protein
VTTARLPDGSRAAVDRTADLPVTPLIASNTVSDIPCLDCTCSSPQTASHSGRLLLATQVDHTVTALRTMARRHGLALRPLAPGLLALDTSEAEEFIALARAELSSVEAAEVRCVVLSTPDLPQVAMLTQALTAPTLAAAGARVQHADLLPLFADEANRFHAVYQPIVALPSRRPVGVEALLRATTPGGLPVTPDVLFPAAEAAGWTHLIDRVGRTTALRDAAGWLPADQLLFINFIPTSIYRPEVCLRTTEQAARRAGIGLGQVVFEVTEGHQVQDIDHLEAVFDYYRSHDCKVALDDLGAGYSSLNLLVRLRPDIVKLDKDLVQALPDATSVAVVTAIVEMVHSYGGQVLAECVETEEQAAVATDLGADLGQGWLFGRPERRTATTTTGVAKTTVAAVPVEVEVSAEVDPSRPDGPVAVHTPRGLHLAGAGWDGMNGLLVRAVDGSVSGVVVVDVRAADHPMVYVNSAFERMTGYTSAEVLGRNCRLLQSEETEPAVVRALSMAIRRGEEHNCVLLNRRKDGTAWWNELHLSPVRNEHGRLTHYLGYQHDVTARVEAELALARQATRDSLTGLANRSHLLHQLQVALDSAEAGGHAVAVLFIDLDGFKVVNDTHGHAAGDSVLVQVADRLRAVLRDSDLICRNGGDEFVAVLRDLDPLDAVRIADRAARDVTASLQRPFVAGPGSMALGGSVGVAIYPQDGSTPDRLLAVADSDMYQAKKTAVRPSMRS